LKPLSILTNCIKRWQYTSRLFFPRHKLRLFAFDTFVTNGKFRCCRPLAYRCPWLMLRRAIPKATRLSLSRRSSDPGTTFGVLQWFWCKLLKGSVSCDNCRDTEPTSAQDLFKGRHFDQEIIILCVRWYITFKLSFHDLVQMMAERGITATVILRGIELAEKIKKHQFNLRPLSGKATTAPEVWARVSAA
jgi:hypothetical protein